ncbi:hypothetical protein BT96DRAFT_920313 [Gymnopus androsaceus JB14]|uniref:Uncharacterized protein n=1 Tax=Gymnopus androsaceus JB14 TaxID=1447944 RepID=A0A6A4HK63_9AGAR|nr:hypothetical protein BT96DRAFT_920313 [Gymnopus androsaceus JB14]
MSTTLPIATKTFCRAKISRPALSTRSIGTFSRPPPPPLPRELQLEFEELQKKSESLPNPALPTAPLPETPVKMEGNITVNPIAGEQGGPKLNQSGKSMERIVKEIGALKDAFLTFRARALVYHRCILNNFRIHLYPYVLNSTLR